MPIFKVTIKRVFGEVAFDVDKPEEVGQRLSDSKKVVEALEADHTLTYHVREPKLGYDEIYRINDDGFVELLCSTGQNIDAIGLALFGYDPYPATSQQVIRSSGVTDAAVYIGQPKYKKYFASIDNKYLITPEGKLWIIKKVIPQLRKAAKSKQPA